MVEEIIVETQYGRVGGIAEDSVAVFRGVPYAAPPVDGLRFEPPQPPQSWPGVRDVTRHGLLPPQTPSRLARVLGDYQLPQGEDCLHLTVTTPAADGGKRPVIVWLHGGAFITGGNAIPWYDGSGFARHHEVVFVGVNYRLGALGFLYAEGVSPANLGLRDQWAALAWVRDNIAAFGGDPAQVTLVGQSAGAISAFALLARKDSSALFHRAVLQSGRLGALRDHDSALAAGQAMVAASGLSPRDFRRLPLEDLLRLQVAQIRAGAQAFASTATPFGPCADGDVIPVDTMVEALTNASDKQFIIGWTRDEMAAFFAGNEQIAQATPAQISTALEREWGENWRHGQAFATARAPGGSPDQVLGAAINECIFAGSSVLFAERLMPVAPIWLYRFDWAAPGNLFGACHCIEVPFVFNNATRWRPPMLDGANQAKVAALGDVIQAAWAAFARTGDPNHARLPLWPPYQSAGRWALRIDHMIEAVGDLGGVTLQGRARPVRLTG